MTPRAHVQSGKIRLVHETTNRPFAITCIRHNEDVFVGKSRQKPEFSNEGVHALWQHFLLKKARRRVLINAYFSPPVLDVIGVDSGL